MSSDDAGVTDDDAASMVAAARARQAPTKGGEDELLADPPMGAPPGGMQGYSSGRRLRVVIGAIVLVVAGGAGWTIKRMRDTAEAERNAPKLPDYELAADDPGELGERPRQLVWSEGPARLGLSRQLPGVQEIVLPDRRIRLAPGHDVAQLRIDVQDGKTTELKVLVGDIVQLPPEGATAMEPAGSPPARSATAP